MVQWIGIHLPKQETWVRSLVQKIPHATEQLDPCAAWALSPSSATVEAWAA